MAPLARSFVPAAKFNREYRALIKTPAQFEIALESATIIKHRLIEIDISLVQTLRYLERTLKFMLWSYGGHTLYLKGDRVLATALKEIYSKQGERAFDISIMEKAYLKDFQVHIVDELPGKKGSKENIGGFLNGSRIGFDLGASDYKVAAVKEGKVIFSQEIPWNPVIQKDPSYHYQKINEGLKLAAEKLDKIDAIGGSSAGVVIDNQIRIASLFRSVEEKLFNTHALSLFSRIEKEWGVPLKVINDGDVTALAGSLSLKRGSILGIAMGSSEACGYIDQEGNVRGWLNELAFAPIDYAEDAAQDEWSQDYGVGAMYFSQQAVNRLALSNGMTFPDEMGLPERLVEVQEKCEVKDPLCSAIFETIGIYLGHTIVHYADFYKFDTVLILGRVTSGRGGELIINQAKQILARDYPDFCVDIVVPKDEERRVGQAIAAASLVEV